MRKLALLASARRDIADRLDALFYGSRNLDREQDLQRKYEYVVEAHAHWKELAQRCHREKQQVRKQLEKLLTKERFERVFWKQTIDADLNTVPGCEQAADVIHAYVWLALYEVLEGGSA